jgi:hypothetical protein
MNARQLLRLPTVVICLRLIFPALSACAAPKPVPKLQAVPLPGAEISFQRDGRELCRFQHGTNFNRPFVFPVNGPSGRSLTRMGHPHDPVGHSHHNSVWLSHADVNGITFWEDKGRGRIVHQRVERLEDGDDEAAVLTRSDWLATNSVLLRERRAVAVRALPDDDWLLVIDVELEAARPDVTLGKTPFGLLGVRVAKTMGVNDGGGTIRNSEGAVNEKEVFWKRARWVDYSGPIAPGREEGVTLLDHPANPNHPSVFHVRNDGWMGASLTFDAPRVLQPGEPLRLRYGLLAHGGVGSTNALDARWKAFAELPARVWDKAKADQR